MIMFIPIQNWRKSVFIFCDFFPVTLFPTQICDSFSVTFFPVTYSHVSVPVVFEYHSPQQKIHLTLDCIPCYYLHSAKVICGIFLHKNPVLSLRIPQGNVRNVNNRSSVGMNMLYRSILLEIFIRINQLLFT